MAGDASEWLKGLAEGDDLSAQRLWESYFGRIVALARRRLGDADRRMSDEEDVALSAFHSLCRGAAAGKFDKLDNRDDLWKLLATITARKAIAQQRRAFSQKRGGGKLRGESALMSANQSESTAGIDNVPGNEPTSEFVVELNEQCQHLLDQLHDGSLKTVALMRLEGCSTREIADELGYNIRTIEKKISRIKEKWSRHDSA